MIKRTPVLLYTLLLILQGDTLCALAQGDEKKEEKNFLETVIEGVKNNKEKVAAAAIVAAGIGTAALHTYNQSASPASTTNATPPSPASFTSLNQSCLKSVGFYREFADKALFLRYHCTFEVENQRYTLDIKRGSQKSSLVQWGDKEGTFGFNIWHENNLFKTKVNLSDQCTQLPQALANVVTRALRYQYGEFTTLGTIHNNQVSFHHKQTNQVAILDTDTWKVTINNKEVGTIIGKQYAINNELPVFQVAWQPAH